MMYNELNKKEQPFAGFAGYGGGASGLGAKQPAAPVSSNWEILFAAQSKTQSTTTPSQNPYGAPGGSSFRTSTESNTGASGRTQIGDGVGLYSAFFNKTGITKIAIACDHDGSGNTNMNPSSNFTRYIIYDLVATTTKTIYTTLYDLDTYNLNNSSWAGNDSVFGSNSVDNFTAGSAVSGSMNTSSGHFQTSSGGTPSSFCIWGVNRDSDNDTQVLCAYSGNLTTGKGDAWRGDNPAETFFSYWGNDWHSNTQSQTISVASQTPPGFNNNSTVLSSVGGSTSEVLYMLGYTP